VFVELLVFQKKVYFFVIEGKNVLIYLCDQLVKKALAMTGSTVCIIHALIHTYLSVNSNVVYVLEECRIERNAFASYLSSVTG
jgi:hypothetical protein